jgi:hypothetical protein
LLHVGNEQIFDGVEARARVADCTDFVSKEWIHDGQYIKLASDEAYCLTNRGQNANVGDYTLHTKPCPDRPDFMWPHTSYDPRSLYQFYPDDGCIATKNDSMEKFTKLVMGDCAGPSSTWNVVHTNGVKIFRNGLDKSMCVQAGLGGYVSHGTVLRLMPCNENEYLQKFQWDDETSIKLSVSNGEALLQQVKPGPSNNARVRHDNKHQHSLPQIRSSDPLLLPVLFLMSNIGC